jgi:hypothetical protein
MKNQLLFIASFVLICSVSNAQITITSNDFPVIGDSHVLVLDTMPTISVGSAGTSQVWDLTGIQPHLLDTNDFSDPTLSTAAASFPNATLLSTNLLGQNFHNLNPDSITLEGFYTRYIDFAGQIIDLGAERAFPFDNPLTTMTFPSEYGSNYIDTGAFRYRDNGDFLDAFGLRVDSIGSWHTSILHSEIDGEGTVETPAGIFDVIRQKVMRIRIDTLKAYVKNDGNPFDFQDDIAVISLGLAGKDAWYPINVDGFPNPIIDTLFYYTYYANNEGFAVARVDVDKNDNVLSANYLYKDNLIAFNLSKTASTCIASCNGTATVTGLGGSSPYSYTWSNGESTGTAVNLCSGQNTVTVTDQLSASQVLTVTINLDNNWGLGLNSKTDVTCNGVANGLIDPAVSGGTPPYVYAWSNGSTADALVNISAGSYSLTVTENNGCFLTLSSIVTEPTAVAVNFDVTNAHDAEADGEVTATASGGIAPYSYVWENGATTNTITGLAGGTSYALTVTDGNSCSSVFSSYVTGVENIFLAQNIRIYPNPVSGGVLTISNEKQIQSVKIYNVLGEVVYNEANKTNIVTIQTSSFINGVYFVNIETAEGNITKKIMIL